MSDYCDGTQGVHEYTKSGRRLVKCPECGHVWPEYSGVEVGDLPPHVRADS